MITFVFALRFTAYLAKFKGFLTLGFIHIRLAGEYQPRMNKIEADEARKLNRRPQYKLDATKRRSLMAQNQIPVPKGWSEEIAPKVTKRRISNIPISPPIERTFTHDFFGSQLVIGDIRIGQGLTKKLHRLEINKNQLTIDNVPQDINQGELERIKQVIRESRE